MRKTDGELRVRFFRSILAEVRRNTLDQEVTITEQVVSDLADNDNVDLRKTIQTMIDCIVVLGMQEKCSLDRFKELMVGAVQIARQTSGSDSMRPAALRERHEHSAISHYPKSFLVCSTIRSESWLRHE